jgi:hypothetical protein
MHTLIKAEIKEGDRHWFAHGETREEALHRLRVCVNGEIRFGTVHFCEVGASYPPTADTGQAIPHVHGSTLAGLHGLPFFG